MILNKKIKKKYNLWKLSIFFICIKNAQKRSNTEDAIEILPTSHQEEGSNHEEDTLPASHLNLLTVVWLERIHDELPQVETRMKIFNSLKWIKSLSFFAVGSGESGGTGISQRRGRWAGEWNEVIYLSIYELSKCTLDSLLIFALPAGFLGLCSVPSRVL